MLDRACNSPGSSQQMSQHTQIKKLEREARRRAKAQRKLARRLSKRSGIIRPPVTPGMITLVQASTDTNSTFPQS